MITYITVEDVDQILGANWIDASKKEKSVKMANAWLSGLNLRFFPDEIPDDVKEAGAYASLVAAAGKLYHQKTDSGVVISKSVEAKGVSVSKSFAELSTNSTTLLDPDLQFALALLKPYGVNQSQIRLVRG